MKTHATLISPQDAPRLSALLGVSVHTVLSWRQRNSIPAEHWKALADDGLATLEELAEAAAARRAASDDNSPQAAA